MKVKEFIAKAAIAFDRGKHWLSVLNFFMIVFLTVTSMKEYPAFSFLRSAYWIALIVLLACVFVMLIGYFDIKRGVYKKELMVKARIDPVQQRVFRELDYIRDHVGEKWHTKRQTFTSKKQKKKGI